jgi:basic membrane protein A
MNKKRLTAVLAAAVMTISLLAGCGNSNQQGSTGSSSTSKKSAIKIGLSTDEGGLNDKSFNQAANTGIKRAVKDLGIDPNNYKAVESKQQEDYQPNLDALVSNGSDITFGVGYQMQQAMTNIAKKYKNKDFAIIDTVVDEPNVESITFKEQEGSFLMGVIAGKMTKTNKVGFIGGQSSPLIEKFEAGFAAGVKAVNPSAAVGLISPDGKTPGTTVRYAESFNDTNKGYELAKQLYGSGCDVIYHAAGGVGIGMFRAAQEIKDSGKQVWGIGVDMDQAVTLPQYADVILSSMVKKVDVATYNTVKEVAEGKFQGGKHIELGLKDNGVGIAGTSSKNTPKEVLDVVTKFENAIKSGKFVVPSTRDAVRNFTAPQL